MQINYIYLHMHYHPSQKPSKQKDEFSFITLETEKAEIRGTK